MDIKEGFDSNYRYVLVAARRARQLAEWFAAAGECALGQGLPRGAG